MKHITTINPSLSFLMSLSKTETLLSRYLDSALGGLSFKEFTILYHLSESEDQKLRRIDLAMKMGLSPSGITRILLAMEKVGLVSKDVHPSDARVSFVLLAPGGKRRFEETLEKASRLSEEVLPSSHQDETETASALLRLITGTIH